jgi:ribose transport system permease protein
VNMKTKIMNIVKAFMVPVVLYLIVLLLAPGRVGNLDSITSMLTLAVVPTVIAYGVHFGFTSGIIDFSVGSRMTLAGIFGCICGCFFGPIGMILGSVLASLLLAAIIGGLFALLKIPSFVISLGSLMVFEVIGEHLTKYCAGVLPEVATYQYLKAPGNMQFLGKAPYNFLVLIVIAVIFELVNTRTKIANQARVVGSDELIARNVGIEPMKVKFGTFILGSIFLALAAVVSTCYSSAVGYAANMGSMATVFKPMMAVIIGMSLGRIVRSCVGIFIGNLCLSVIFTGIIALGWPDNLQNIFLGLFLVGVLGLPTIQRTIAGFKRRSAARKAHTNMPSATGTKM